MDTINGWIEATPPAYLAFVGILLAVVGTGVIWIAGAALGLWRDADEQPAEPRWADQLGPDPFLDYDQARRNDPFREDHQ